MALYTYESPEAGDLTFVEGDVVMVTEREGEWWRGCIGDQTGVFPSNYVRPVEPEVCQVVFICKTELLEPHFLLLFVIILITETQMSVYDLLLYHNIVYYVLYINIAKISQFIN